MSGILTQYFFEQQFKDGAQYENDISAQEQAA